MQHYTSHECITVTHALTFYEQSFTSPPACVHGACLPLSIAGTLRELTHLCEIIALVKFSSEAHCHALQQYRHLAGFHSIATAN